MSSFLFTSESVSMGHPDKVSDQVSDGILDALIAVDPRSRVACETLCTTNYVQVSGEITSNAALDDEGYREVVRDVLRDIGYTIEGIDFHADNCEIDVRLHSQSGDIAQGVDVGGAGDQGLMFGYASNQTEELMPMPIALAHRLINRLTEVRQQGAVDWLRPDSKSQVTVEYVDGVPRRVSTVVISTQHADSIEQAGIAEFINREVVTPVIPAEFLDQDTRYHVNPTGSFIIGGPHGDTGLTGRKIIVDTYGGWGRHGGGAFSGKDPTKVDRSAAYMARYIAKNVVAAGLAAECEVQLAYAIGVAEPVSVNLDCHGTATVSQEELEKLVGDVFPNNELTPAEIIESLDLRRPIYRKTAAGGHFGRNEIEFTWERTDRAELLRESMTLTQDAT